MERHSTTVHLAYYFHIETGTVNSVELGVYKPMCGDMLPPLKRVGFPAHLVKLALA